MALTEEQQALVDAQVASYEATATKQLEATKANEMLRCKADCLRMAQAIIFENRRLADASTPDMTADDVTALAASLNTWLNA